MRGSSTQRHRIAVPAFALTLAVAGLAAAPGDAVWPGSAPPAADAAASLPGCGGAGRGFQIVPADRPPALDDLDVERAAELPGPRLVKLEGPPCDAWRAAISAAGGRIIQYLPVDTLLVWTTAGRDAESAIARLPFVRWVGPLPARSVMSPKLAAGGEVPQAMDLLVIDDGDLGATLAAVGATGGRVVEHYPAQSDGGLQHVVAVVAPAAAAASGLARIPTVLWIEPSPSPPDLAGEMASAVNAGLLAGTTPQLGYRPWLETRGLDGAGVVWSVVDSGVDHAHPDLGPFAGVNYPGCETDPPGGDREPIGHGTAVAGLIAGTGAGLFGDGGGFAYGLGVAPGVSLVSQNAVCGEGPWPPTGGWPQLAQDAVAAGASGSNNSWNGEVDLGYGIMEREFDVMVRDADLTTAARAEPLIVVFSAGNDGPEPATAKRPAAAKNIIVAGAVGTSRDGSSTEVVAEFSGRGPALDGRIVPTVVAPGEGVAATRHLGGGLVFGVFEIPDTAGRS